MEQEQNGEKAAATTQIASLLVIADQLAAATQAVVSLAEVARQQLVILERIANTLEERNA